MVELDLRNRFVHFRVKPFPLHHAGVDWFDWLYGQTDEQKIN